MVWLMKTALNAWLSFVSPTVCDHSTTSTVVLWPMVTRVYNLPVAFNQSLFWKYCLVLRKIYRNGCFLSKNYIHNVTVPGYEWPSFVWESR